MITAEPLTFGQLSIWRDVERIPPESRHQANIGRVLPLPPGLSVDGLRDAFAVLRSRHESLRTRYDFADPDVPRQILNPPADFVDIPHVKVPAGADPDEVANELADELTAQCFDLSTEESWRAVIVVADNGPTHIVLVLHHIAVDLWSVDILRDEFQALLEGREIPESTASLRELAAAQHSAKWEGRRDAAAAHLREVFTVAAVASTGEVDDGPSALVRANGCSRVALATSDAHAAALGITAPSLMLASYCYAAHQLTGVPDILVNTMTTNRLFPGIARLVSSMNQWARMISHHAGEPFADFARQIHWGSTRAYRHGCYSVDVDAAIRREVESTIRPIRPEFSFNYVRIDAPEPDPGPDWAVTKLPSVTGGPSFYLVATQGGTLDLTARTRWPDFSDADMATFLTTVHTLIRGV